ncbi:MAG: CotH kinase family protein [Dysgonamonadaceae bacterium]|jgi:hypothetical protein|nr:CotH kinase family protein [Dysgonamonadaceae bacterium]
MNIKPFLITLFLSLCLPFYIKAQTRYELTGDIIYNDRCNNQDHPVSNAFDNDIDTYFMSCPPFGNWIGLDLGEKHIITQVAYCPRMDLTSGSDYRERLQLGVFEGANNPDFGDAIPLFIIPGLAERQLTEKEINCTKGFRYVRFVFPYAIESEKSSYMAELKFYGYGGNGDHSQLPQLTNIPLVSIHTVDNRDITSKEEYVKGIITVISGNGTKIYTDSLEIRGRGNNSWTHPKKPYRIKLSQKARLLDLPANARNWTLINSYGDKTLMRNILAYDFSRRIEMPYTSPSEAVDLVLNGDYKGCYQLSDHIDVRKNRVDIEEMSPSDVSGVNLTGGYMIEIDAYAYDEPKKFTSYRYSIPVSIKYPDSDEIVKAQEDYIEAHFNKLTDAVFSDSFKDPQDGFRKYLYIDTFLKYFLVGEYSGNTDTYWSARMYKRRGDDKFNFGPVWDFDLGFENDSRTYRVNDKTDWIALSSYGSAAGSARSFIRRIMSDEDMLTQLKFIYSYYRDRNVSKEVLLQEVDNYAAYLNQSQDLNFKRWRILNRLVHQNPAVYGSYEGEVNNVKNYIAGRIDWIDQKLNYVPGQTLKIKRVDSQNTSTITVGSEKRTIRITGVQETVRIRIINLMGRIVFDSIVSEDSDLTVDRGVYFVEITGHSVQKSIYKTIVR